MNFMKNSHIARKYGVTPTTVSNWIESAKQKRNQLQLHYTGKKYYILDNENNQFVISQLINSGKKHKTLDSRAVVKSSSDILKIFNQSQFIELVYNLKSKILPVKFTYFHLGAKYWDDFVNTAGMDYFDDEHQGLETMKASIEYIKVRLSGYKKINIFDVGPGNGVPIKVLIDNLRSKGVEVTYTAFDISKEMTGILENNLKKWYPKLETKFLTGDIEDQNIRDLIYTTKLKHKDSASLVLLLGCTIGNFIHRDTVLKNLRDSMTKDDFLLFDCVNKSEKGYDFVSHHLKLDNILALDYWVLDLLNLRPHLDLSIEYVQSLDSICHVFKFNKDVELELQDPFNDVLIFNKGEILIGHYIHSFDQEEIIKMLKRARLKTSLLSEFPERSESFIMCEV